METARKFLKIFLDSPVHQLVAIIIASLLIYISAFLAPINLLELYDQPRLDRDLLFYQGRPAYLKLIAAFIGAWALYLLGYRISLKVEGRRAWIVVFVGMVAFIAVFLFVAPFDAADIYDNIMHARILGVYGANPFEQMIADYPDDPFYEYAAWKQAPSAYGPLWELLAGLTARFAGDGIIANVLAFKILPGLFHLAVVGVVVLYLRKTAPDQALGGALLLGWNPTVLYEIWGNGHNDSALAFWFLLAAWCIFKRRYTLAALSLLAGALIKFIPILLIPTVLLIAWRNMATSSARFVFLAKTALLAILMIVAAYLPFWNGFESMSVERRMNMFTTSIPAAIYRVLAQEVGAGESARWVSLGALALLAVFVLWQTFRTSTIEPARDFTQITFNILAFYLLVTCLWFQQWYAVWLLFLTPLLSNSSLRLALLFGFWVLSKQLVFGPYFVQVMHFHPETRVRLEPWFTASVLGVPWLYASGILLRKRFKRENHAAP